MIGMTTLDIYGRLVRRNSQIVKHKPKSKKRLFTDLAAPAAQDPKVGNETYGRMSCIYLDTGSVATRLHLERALSALGHRIECLYHPGSGTVEIIVSYFKGHHWNE